jgi:predicted transcriptional regulator
VGWRVAANPRQLVVRRMSIAEAKSESISEALPDDAAEAAADAASEAQIDAGKGIPHVRVRSWLESWGKPKEHPCPLPPE